MKITETVLNEYVVATCPQSCVRGGQNIDAEVPWIFRSRTIFVGLVSLKKTRAFNQEVV